MKISINPVFIVMAALVVAIAFLSSDMINMGNMPLAAVAPFIQKANPLVLPAVISAGAGIINGITDLFSKKSANKQNIAMQRETNALNYQMFQEGNEFNRQMAFDMFNAENEYNLPKNQVKRLLDAGLNPALAGENATATTGNGDASTPSAAAASPMVAPQVQPVGSPFQSVFANIEQLASAFEKVNRGNLDSAQKEFVLEQAKSEQLKQINQDTQNAILQAYGMAQADADVQKTLKEISQIDAEISTLVKQGKLADAERRLKNLQAIAQKNDNKLFAETFEYLVQQASEKVNLIRAEVTETKERAETERTKQKENLASAKEHEAGARYTNEQAKQLEEMHDDIVSMKENEAIIMDKEAKIKIRTWVQEANKIVKEASKMHYESEEQRMKALEAQENAKRAHELLKLAEKDNSSYYWRLILNTLGVVTAAGAAVYGFRRVKSSSSKPDVKQSSVDGRVYRQTENGLLY